MAKAPKPTGPAALRLGDNVRRAREAKGWTQEDLSRAGGLSVVQISRIERGRDIRLSTLIELLTSLEITPDELLKGVY